MEVSELLRKLLQKPEAVPAKQQAGTPPQSPVAASSEQPEGTRSLSVRERGKAAKKHWKALEDAQEGERNDTIAKAACGLGSIYANAEPEKRDEMFAKLTGHCDRLANNDVEIKEFRNTATEQWKFGAQSPATRPDGTDGKKSKESNGPAEFANICALMGLKARFNLANESEEWWFKDEGKWRPLIPHESRILFSRIWEEYGWNIPPKDRLNLLAHVTDTNRVHPYRDELLSYLDYEDPELSNIPIERSLHWWVVNPDGAYEQWCQRAIWGQMVSRIMDDPIPQRTIVTLRGPAKTGKSALVKHLLPDKLGGVGKLDMSGSRRDIIVLLKKRYAVEFPELAGMSKREAADLKSILGAGSMDIRILRTTESMEIIYKAAIIGTANEEPTLYNDPALMDRFAYLDVRRNDEYDPAVWIPKIRKHYLAKALKEYKEGENYNVMPEHLIDNQMKQSAPSVNIDQSMIDRINQIDYPNLPERFTILEYSQHAGLARNYSEYRRNRLYQTLPRVLRSLGFTSRKGKGGAEWWERPSNGEYPESRVNAKQGDTDYRKGLASRAYIERTASIPGWKKDLTELD